MPPWKIAECRGFRTWGRRRSPMACLPCLAKALMTRVVRTTNTADRNSLFSFHRRLT